MEVYLCGYLIIYFILTIIIQSDIWSIIVLILIINKTVIASKGMNDNNVPFTTLHGIFYTNSDIFISGRAILDNDQWIVNDGAGNIHKYNELYLDRYLRIYAPKNYAYLSLGRKYIQEIISQYTKELKSLWEVYSQKPDDDSNYKIKIKIKINMKKIALEEYEELYYKYFMTNSSNYIKNL